MAKNEFYVAVGEESTRTTAESSTVGFIPLEAPVIPTFTPDDQMRNEVRGEESILGERTMRRESLAWTYDFTMPFYTEAGTTAGIVGTLLKHFFGDVTSAQNASTGQYYHMYYPVQEPFATAGLGTKALTFNVNYSEGSTNKNHAFTGGRISKISLSQEPGQGLMITFSCFGTVADAASTAISSPTYAAENLRCDYVNLTAYNGTITRAGSAPNYTDFTFGSATSFCPNKITLDIENGFTDSLRLCGKQYADQTKFSGRFKSTLAIDIDFEDPAAGFSAVDELNTRIATTTSTNNFHFYWNTGTQAGTGDNHGLYVDLPVLHRVGGDVPEFNLEADPIVTLSYEGLYDASTTTYQVGMMLKNTASAV